LTESRRGIDSEISDHLRRYSVIGDVQDAASQRTVSRAVASTRRIAARENPRIGTFIHAFGRILPCF
jgi:hypothetical protein